MHWEGICKSSSRNKRHFAYAFAGIFDATSSSSSCPFSMPWGGPCHIELDVWAHQSPHLHGVV